MNTLKVPIRCANCNYPEKYGSRVEAEIKYSSRDKIVQKHWRCPNCESTTSIEFYPKKFEKNPLKGIFSIKSDDSANERKGLEELVAGGGVEKLD